jgi:hypothetical protein
MYLSQYFFGVKDCFKINFTIPFIFIIYYSFIKYADIDDMRSFCVNLESTFYDPRKSVLENYVAKMDRIFNLYANINGTFILPQKNFLKTKLKFFLK